MKIETLLNIGDAIYFIHEKKIIQSFVQQIRIEITDIGKKPRSERHEVLYLCNKEPEKNVNIKCEEQYAFRSKEELLKSL